MPRSAVLSTERQGYFRAELPQDAVKLNAIGISSRHSSKHPPNNLIPTPLFPAVRVNLAELKAGDWDEGRGSAETWITWTIRFGEDAALHNNEV